MGWSVKKHPALLRQIIAEGHSVASHTNSHKDLTRMSMEKLRNEISMPKEAIRVVIGKPPLCVRPPYGKGNRHVSSVIRSYGMLMVPMGFNSFDYKKQPVKQLVHWVVSNAISGRVILLHDGYSYRERTVKALPAIIEGIRKKGLKFSTICNP